MTQPFTTAAQQLNYWRTPEFAKAYDDWLCAQLAEDLVRLAKAHQGLKLENIATDEIALEIAGAISQAVMIAHQNSLITSDLQNNYICLDPAMPLGLVSLAGDINLANRADLANLVSAFAELHYVNIGFYADAWRERL